VAVCQDHAFAGIGAGAVAVLCVNPLDLLKVKFFLSTRGHNGAIGHGIHASEGWRRSGPEFMRAAGVILCVTFRPLPQSLRICSYTRLKRRATIDASDRTPTVSQYLLISTKAVRILSTLASFPITTHHISRRGAVTAILTNSI
jgi:solute carrier family 25 folate transporter 32